MFFLTTTTLVTLAQIQGGPDLFNTGVGIAACLCGLVFGIGAFWSKIKNVFQKSKPKPESFEDLSDKQVDAILDETPKLVFPVNLQTHSFVHERITEFRVLNNADFISICYFHNGGNFLDGSPIKRISSVFESLGEGKESFSFYFKNVFVSEVLPILQSIDTSKAALLDTNKLENGLLRTLLTTRDIHTVACIPVIKTTQVSGHLVIGVILAGFSKEPDRESVLQHAKKLAALLEIQLFGDRPYFHEGD